ncbi:MAG: acetyl-CoA carboxylase biotin carboxyl carrier protein [Clostridium sp.]
MDFEQIKELVTLINSSDLAFFELSDGNNHIKMDKSLNRNGSECNNVINNTKESTESETSVKKVEKSITSEEVKNVVKNEKKEDDSNVSIITSPMVGTFYSASSPEADPFVKVGDRVSKGKVICIIEAMKLMNEIESEYSGEIVECLMKDGDMVEYGQPLFKIKED